MTNPLQPDFRQACAFLATLAPEGPLTFQTIPERPDVKGNGGAQIRHGEFEELTHELSKLNNQGHGVFVMVNEGNGRGRKTSDVMRVRAYVLDLDGAPVEPVLTCPEPPHIVVESSPGKWHTYWLARDCPLDQFKPRQQALAAMFGGDPAVCDLPRVMRLPGFWHQKSTPVMTNLVRPQK